MLTKDENIVEVGLLVQYRVKDPAAYVFNVQDPDAVLATTAEVALRSAIGQMPIDDVITERRADVQESTRNLMVQRLDSYNSGILVTDVRLQVADAPDQVRDAFHEVVRAREDRERTINEGQAYREDILPRARGEARQIIEAATAFREERIRLARGDSERFVSILRGVSEGADSDSRANASRGTGASPGECRQGDHRRVGGQRSLATAPTANHGVTGSQPPAAAQPTSVPQPSAPTIAPTSTPTARPIATVVPQTGGR